MLLVIMFCEKMITQQLLFAYYIPCKNHLFVSLEYNILFVHNKHTNILSLMALSLIDDGFTLG